MMELTTKEQNAIARRKRKNDKQKKKAADEHLCSQCAKRPPLPSGKCCAECLAYHSRWKRRDYRRRMREKGREVGVPRGPIKWGSIGASPPELPPVGSKILIDLDQLREKQRQRELSRAAAKNRGKKCS